MTAIIQNIKKEARKGLATLLVPAMLAMGGCSRERANPYGFSEFGKLRNGAEYGAQGSLKFLLDKEGKPISKGFHDFVVFPNDSEYIAQIGSCYFLLNKDGQIVKSYTKDCLKKDLMDYSDAYARVLYNKSLLKREKPK